ncbi:MAG: acetylornithine deacetylase/succinyl-diaminopimelate desuccinylase family protein [Luteitalea sp.]|nr:acetylornithine deacetylase/succinyl-diaminopimelate desuccinylase family protein [Luteitalea sp.]
MAVGVLIAERVLSAVDAAADEIVDFTSTLIRIPTVNPPGEAYEDCARVIGERLVAGRFEVDYAAAEGRPEHTPVHPRVNVVGLRRGRAERPAVHLNGHLDVVPAGEGWTMDPFSGAVNDGRIYGRGACDMKAGIAAAVYAAEAIRRAGIEINGSIEISATVDEESGGFAGVAWLAEQGRLTKERLDYVIIPEPLGVDRICVGHRGVYWFEILTYGRAAHGSMPFLGVSAIDQMSLILDRIRRELAPVLAGRTTAVPVVPDLARHPSINVNAFAGGQPIDGIQTPCVAGTCRAIFDRRFLLEEGYDATKREIETLLQRAAAEVPALKYELRDLMIVHPVRTPEDSPLIAAVGRGVEQVIGRRATQVASPGTYDHKHVERIGGIRDCVAYGPGVLELAHQPDEWCGVDDVINATKVLALTILDLTETR